jgi:hypothetical protein
MLPLERFLVTGGTAEQFRVVHLFDQPKTRQKMNNTSIPNNTAQPSTANQSQHAISVAPSLMTGGINGEGGGYLVVPISSHAIEGFLFVLLAAFTAVVLPGRK